MDELAKGLFGNKLLQGAFPMTQEDAYIHKEADEETDEQPHTPVGNKDRPDAYRRNFNDPDEGSPETEEREEAGADEETPEESPEESPEATPAATPEATPETPETPMTPEEATAEQTVEATPDAETPTTPMPLEESPSEESPFEEPEVTPATAEGTAEQTIEATPEPETPVTPPSLSPGTPEQEDARERGRQAVAEAMGRIGTNADDEGATADADADDMADAAAAEDMGEPATPMAETPMGETPEGTAGGAGGGLPSDGNTTIGNFLISTIHAGFTVAADRAFGAGRMTQDERIAISSAISEALKTFSRVLDEQHTEIRDREMPSALAVLAH
jgi:hypothetical protein